MDGVVQRARMVNTGVLRSGESACGVGRLHSCLSVSTSMLELPVEPMGVVAKWCVCARVRGVLEGLPPRLVDRACARVAQVARRCGLVLCLIGGAAANNLDTVCWTARGRGEMRGRGMGRGGRGDN